MAVESISRLACQTPQSPHEIVRLLRLAETLSPDNVGVCANLIRALSDIEEFDAASIISKRALKLHPNSWELSFNTASLAQAQMKTDSAIYWCRKALQLNPDHPQIHFNLFHSLALQGRLAEGWAPLCLPHGPFLPPHAKSATDSIAPTGMAKSLKGKHLVVFSDQGLGDFVMFARYPPLIKGKVTVEVQAGLERAL